MAAVGLLDSQVATVAQAVAWGVDVGVAGLPYWLFEAGQQGRVDLCSQNHTRQRLASQGRMSDIGETADVDGFVAPCRRGRVATMLFEMVSETIRIRGAAFAGHGRIILPGLPRSGYVDFLDWVAKGVKTGNHHVLAHSGWVTHQRPAYGLLERELALWHLQVEWQRVVLWIVRRLGQQRTGVARHLLDNRVIAVVDALDTAPGGTSGPCGLCAVVGVGFADLVQVVQTVIGKYQAGGAEAQKVVITVRVLRFDRGLTASGFQHVAADPWQRRVCAAWKQVAAIQILDRFNCAQGGGDTRKTRLPT